MPNRVTLNDSVLDIVCKLSEGNPGAVSVLAQWLKRGEAVDPDACHPMIQMCSLDDLDIVGSRIWILYKDVCRCDLRVFLGVLRSHQLGYLDTSDLKAAARGDRKLDCDALLAQVEAYLPAFERPPAVDAVGMSSE